MPGETSKYINIIVKKGESFKAPSAEGLPLSDGISADTPMWWVDENLNFYKPGDTVPADVSTARSRSHRTIIPIFSATELPPLFCLKAEAMTLLRDPGF